MSSDGSSATARAMATRCACPPDSSRGCRLAYLAGSRPTRSSSSSTRLRLAFLSPARCAASGSSTMERTCHLGSSEPNGSCQTNCRCRRAEISALPLSLVSSMSRKRTEPDFGRGACSTERASVDLPDPVSPTMPSVSPGMMSNDTPETACTTPPFVPPAWRTTNSWTRSRTDSSGCFPTAQDAWNSRTVRWCLRHAAPPFSHGCQQAHRWLSACSISPGGGGPAVVGGARAARLERAAGREHGRVRRTAADHGQLRCARASPGAGSRRAAPGCTAS